MVTWMQHKEHGKHPAQGAEIEPMLKAGWTICPPKEKKQVAAVAAVAVVEQVITQFEPPEPSPPQAEKRRPGRPPKSLGL